MKPLFQLLLWLVALLPRPLAQGLGAAIGRLNYLLNSRAAKVTRVNLGLCFPDADVESLTRQSLIETGRTALETPAVWLRSTERIDQWIEEIDNEDLITQAVASDRGLLILLPHVGNWELFNVLFRRFGTMTALYQPPRVAAMREIMASIRARHGNEIVPTTRKGLTRLYRTLASGGSVVVLPDQVPAAGEFVKFFGVEALTDPLAVRLIRQTNPLVLGLAIIRTPAGRFAVRVLPAPEAIHADDAQALCAMNRLVEACVELAPAQYQWEYKRFRERPAGELKVYRFGKVPARHR